MKFPEPSETTTVGEGEPLPDGEHTCEITEAKERMIDGRDLMIVTFTAVEGRHLPVVKFLDAEQERDLVLVSQLREALGLQKGQDLFPEDLSGRRVVITTKVARERSGEIKTTKRGEPIVYVNAIAPAAPAQPAARRPNTGAAKVAAARGEPAGNGDDIPF